MRIPMPKRINIAESLFTNWAMTIAVFIIALIVLPDGFILPAGSSKLFL